MNYFDNNGRRIPSSDMRVFGEVPQNYYRIDSYEVNYAEILDNSKKFGGVDTNITLDAFKSACEGLKRRIELSANYQNLFNGVAVPIICKKIESDDDLGRDLQDIELPNLQKSFNAKFPNCHFKAVLQSNSELAGNISIDERSRYGHLVNACKSNTVIGWYFPQALKEFDVESQRKQMVSLPDFQNVCLSGALDIIAAIIGSPDLLISEENYTPILSMSAYVHKDPRLVLLIKSYGPHMEFWCMTQMLAKNITQVSEQWSGGLTIFDIL